MRALAILAVAPVAIAACHRTNASSKKDDLAPAVSAPAPTVPPVAFGAVPVSSFADAATDGATSAYEQARAYEANGQLWLARLVLEKKALADDGTKRELDLLAKICGAQGDAACIEQCGAKLGRKTKADAGASARRPK